ncbi:hypothetical protein BSK60_02860 [Paenibacillus odorifer]|nr:hypothetical protein BSK60_02860 [Paenibacillus odorifer]
MKMTAVSKANALSLENTLSNLLTDTVVLKRRIIRYGECYRTPVQLLARKMLNMSLFPRYSVTGVRNLAVMDKNM